MKELISIIVNNKLLLLDTEENTTKEITKQKLTFVPSTNDDIPYTSNDIPSTSIEIPSNSNDIPSTNDDIPYTSNDIPSTSIEIPSNSNDIPSTNDDIPYTSNDIPTTSIEIPSNSNDIPTTSIEIPSNSNDIPTTSIEIPSNSNNTPTNSNKSFKIVPSSIISSKIIIQKEDDTTPSLLSTEETVLNKNLERNIEIFAERFLIKEYPESLSFYSNMLRSHYETVEGELIRKNIERIKNKKNISNVIPFSDLNTKSFSTLEEKLIHYNVGNFISNISELDYTYNRPKYNYETLLPINKLKLFCDDMYVFSYYTFTQMEKSKDGLHYYFKLRSKNGGAAGIIISEINNILDYVIRDKNLRKLIKNPRICCTPSLDSNGIYKEVISNIEKNTDYKIRQKVKDLRKIPLNKNEYKVDEIMGFFKVKIDISEFPLRILLDKLPELEKAFFEKGYGFFSFDITRDYANTLDANLLRNCLLSYYPFFREEQDIILKLEQNKNKKPTKQEIKNEIIKNNYYVLLSKEVIEKESGKNILKYYRYLDDGRLLQVKVYNKLVSNFEHKGIGNKSEVCLSEVVYCELKRNVKTFNNYKIKDSGVTRIEITMNGFNEVFTGEDVFNKIMDEEFNIVGKLPCYYEQPIQNQWSILQSSIKSNVLLCNRRTGIINIVYYSSYLTNVSATIKSKEICSMSSLFKNLAKAKSSKETETLINKAEQKWNNRITNIISDFGWSNIPIFVLDYLVEDREITLFNYRLFWKQGPTILTPSAYPSKVYPLNIREMYNPSNLLPNIHNTADFIFRTEQLSIHCKIEEYKANNEFYKVLELNTTNVGKLNFNTYSSNTRKFNFDNKVNEVIKPKIKKLYDGEKLRKSIKQHFSLPINNRNNNDKKLIAFKQYNNETTFLYYNRRNLLSHQIANNNLTNSLNNLKYLFEPVFHKKHFLFLLPYNNLKIDSTGNIKNLDFFITKIKKSLPDYSYRYIEQEKTIINNNTKVELYLEQKPYEKNNVINLKYEESNLKYEVLGWSNSNGISRKSYYVYVRNYLTKNEPFFIKGIFLTEELLKIKEQYNELEYVPLPLFIRTFTDMNNERLKKSCKQVCFYTSEEELNKTE